MPNETDMNLIYLKKGDHWFLPLKLAFTKNKTIEFKFTDAMKVPSSYFNKLFGLSASLNPHKRSVRLGFRYRPDIDKFELVAYCRVDGELETNLVEPVFVTADQIVKIELRSNRQFMRMVVTTDNKEDLIDVSIFKNEHGSRLRFNESWLTHPFWGGVESAPQNMSFYQKGYMDNKVNFRTLMSGKPLLTSIVTMLTFAIITGLMFYFHLVFLWLIIVLSGLVFSLFQEELVKLFEKLSE